MASTASAPACDAIPAAASAEAEYLTAARLVGSHRLALRHPDVATRLRLCWQRCHPVAVHKAEVG